MYGRRIWKTGKNTGGGGDICARAAGGAGTPARTPACKPPELLDLRARRWFQPLPKHPSGDNVECRSTPVSPFDPSRAAAAAATRAGTRATGRAGTRSRTRSRSRAHPRAGTPAHTHTRDSHSLPFILPLRSRIDPTGRLMVVGCLEWSITIMGFYGASMGFVLTRARTRTHTRAHAGSGTLARPPTPARRLARALAPGHTRARARA